MFYYPVPHLTKAVKYADRCADSSAEDVRQEKIDAATFHATPFTDTDGAEDGDECHTRRHEDYQDGQAKTGVTLERGVSSSSLLIIGRNSPLRPTCDEKD